MNNQGAVQTGLDLDVGRDVGVIPEGAGIWHDKFVDEALSGSDRINARQLDAIHLIGDAHAMPVDRGRLGQLVDEPDPDLVALPDADLRPRGGAVIGPNPCAGFAGAKQ